MEVKEVIRRKFIFYLKLGDWCQELSKYEFAKQIKFQKCFPKLGLINVRDGKKLKFNTCAMYDIRLFPGTIQITNLAQHSYSPKWTKWYNFLKYKAYAIWFVLKQDLTEN